MPKLNDYECKLCGFVFEAMTFGDELNPEGNDIIYCKKCGGYTKRLISVPGVNTYNQDAPWIRSVREVVDKDGAKTVIHTMLDEIDQAKLMTNEELEGTVLDSLEAIKKEKG